MASRAASRSYAEKIHLISMPALLAVVIGQAALVVAFARVSGTAALAWGVASSVFLIGFALVRALRIVRRTQDNLFLQLESSTQLLQQLKPRRPLPGTRGYRASPDFLLGLYRAILTRRPNTIVEASSGVSTLVCGYGLEQLGNGGRVVSLEHHAEYAKASADEVELHGLGAVARVAHAPLVEHQIRGETWSWYTLSGIDLPERIDLLVVDGPPRRLQDQARYPALPLLLERLAPGAQVLLDDADRASETEVVARWLSEVAGSSVERVPSEKGMVVFRLPRGAHAPVTS